MINDLTIPLHSLIKKNVLYPLMITVTCKNLFFFENHQKSHHKNHKSELFACFHDFPATIQSYQAICQRTNRITSFVGKFHFIAESQKLKYMYSIVFISVMSYMYIVHFQKQVYVYRYIPCLQC